MTDTLNFPSASEAHYTNLADLFYVQRNDVYNNGVPSYSARIAALDSLSEMIKANRHELTQTVSKDFGNRSVAETELGELMPILNGIKHARSHLKSWMRPTKRQVGMAFRPASAEIIYQPLGVIGILAPWNYPLTLTLAPLVEAIAAGNRAIIKPSELTPLTGELLKRLIGKYFPREKVAVVTGGADLAAKFSSLPFDHLLFTGSTNVGRRVMAAAAPNLTPVTLELGGKSPVVICGDYPLKKAARIIAIGKFFNAGQSCVAPDYVLVPHELTGIFSEEIFEAAKTLYPTIAGNIDYTSIISEHHYERLMDMLDEAKSAGAKVKQIVDASAKAERKIPPAILTDVPLDAKILREEIFGPLIPILGYNDLDSAIRFINDRPKPLAIYGFSHQKEDIAKLLDRTSSGGVTVNGTLLHATQEDLPFGGVGESGMGSYHGYDGFVRMSHARGVMTLSRFNMSHRIAAPYGKITRFVTRLMLGD